MQVAAGGIFCGTLLMSGNKEWVRLANIFMLGLNFLIIIYSTISFGPVAELAKAQEEHNHIHSAQCNHGNAGISSEAPKSKAS